MYIHCLSLTELVRPRPPSLGLIAILDHKNERLAECWNGGDIYINQHHSVTAAMNGCLLTFTVLMIFLSSPMTDARNVTILFPAQSL